MKLKYKVGDKVKIRSDLSWDMMVPFGVDKAMEDYAGDYLTIKVFLVIV